MMSLAFRLYYFLTLILQNKIFGKFGYSPGTDATLPNFSTMVKNLEVFYGLISMQMDPYPFLVLTIIHQGYLKIRCFNLFKLMRNTHEAASY